MSEDKDHSELCARILSDIESRITGNRTAHYAEKSYCNNEETGVGLASLEPQSEDKAPAKEYDHYHILLWGCETFGEAAGKLIDEYLDQGPYSDGEIFWRSRVKVNRYQDFGFTHDLYGIEARFSICKEKD